MSTTLRIGITGGIGSGKSLICKIFSCFGIPIYDADSRAKSLMKNDPILVEQIKNNFGQSSYIDGVLNREYLSRTVFNDAIRLEKLNQLVHPRVAIDSENWMESHTHFPYVVKEAALLFESGSHKLLDKIIVVTAPVALRVQRVISRDPLKSEDDVLKIIRRQMPEEEKINRADFVIANDETELIVPQIKKLHELFLCSAKGNFQF